MIHYFTGTGNSYFIASQLATSLNLSLHALKEGPVEDRDPVVGIVFPVYFGDAPDFVTDALEGLTFPGTPYLFAVATSGTSFGAAFQSIDNALQKKGQHLAFAAHLAMVANSTPAVRQHIAYAYEKLVTAEKALPQLVQKIKDRTSDRSLIKGSLMASFFRTSLGKSLGRRWFRLGVDAARCVKCGSLRAPLSGREPILGHGCGSYGENLYVLPCLPSRLPQTGHYYSGAAHPEGRSVPSSQCPIYRTVKKRIPFPKWREILF